MLFRLLEGRRIIQMHQTDGFDDKRTRFKYFFVLSNTGLSLRYWRGLIVVGFIAASESESVNKIGIQKAPNDIMKVFQINNIIIKK